ncbi:hypothetical protein [Modestobacter marinus]|nr:hypothetical protein [Modestobacter marinus]
MDHSVTSRESFGRRLGTAGLSVVLDPSPDAPWRTVGDFQLLE